jgi:peptidoglycan/xylan/chitin deacetylase (PgdA/CDA1 family)
MIFWFFDSLLSLVCILVGRKRNGTCVILYYHAVLKEQEKQFSRQMDIFKNIVTPLPLDTREPLKKGIKYGSISFDDGFTCLISTAIPVLEKKKIPFTLFIPTAYLGQNPMWIKDSTYYSEETSVMNPDQIKEIAVSPLATIGSHSVSHRNFLDLDKKEAETEFTESRKILGNIVNKPIDLFSFPHGAFHDRHITQVKKAGYTRVFSILPVLTRYKEDEYVIGRTAAEPTDWGIEFRLKILGAYRWLPVAFHLKKKLKKKIMKK